MTESKKKELIEKSAQEFQKLNEDNKMFVLGLYAGHSAGTPKDGLQTATDGIGGEQTVEK